MRMCECVCVFQCVCEDEYVRMYVKYGVDKHTERDLELSGIVQDISNQYAKAAIPVHCLNKNKT